jgi:hypothetical protein
MQEIKDLSDERHKGWCIHCGSWLADKEVSRDHVPTKAFLREPYPSNLPVVSVCVDCNRGFSKDEEYFIAFLGSVMAGSTDPKSQGIPAARRILGRDSVLRARIERSKRTDEAPGGETRFIWQPQNDRIDRVIIKNARGHAFFEYGEPLFEAPAYCRCRPLETLTSAEREEFENVRFGDLAGWPEVGSRMMTRVITGQDLAGPWIVVQDGVYRYAVPQSPDGLLVRIVIAEYLGAEVCWGDD